VCPTGKAISGFVESEFTEEVLCCGVRSKGEGAKNTVPGSIKGGCGLAEGVVNRGERDGWGRKTCWGATRL